MINLLPHCPVGFIIVKSNNLPRPTKTGAYQSSKLYQSPRQAARYAKPGDTIRAIYLGDTQIVMQISEENANG